LAGAALIETLQRLRELGQRNRSLDDAAFSGHPSRVRPGAPAGPREGL